MGPLNGVKIIEVGGIGPGAFLRHDALGYGGRNCSCGEKRRVGAVPSQIRSFDPKPQIHLHQSQNAGRRPDPAQDAGAGGCSPGRVSSRCHGKAGYRAPCLPEEEPQTRLWQDDRLGPRKSPWHERPVTISTILRFPAHCTPSVVKVKSLYPP